MTDDVNDILKQSLLLLLGLVVVVDGACCIILMGLRGFWDGVVLRLVWSLSWSLPPLSRVILTSYEIGIPTQES